MAALLRSIIITCLPTLLFASDTTTEPDVQTEPDVHELLAKIEKLTKRMEKVEKVTPNVEANVEAISDEVEQLETNVTELQGNVTQDPMTFCKDAPLFSPICGLEILLQRSEQWIRWFFLNTTMLSIGVSLVVLFHLAVFTPTRWRYVRRKHRGKLAAVRLLGRNLVILQLYYTHFWWNTDILKNPFYHSLGFILFDTVILWFGCKQVAKWTGMWMKEGTYDTDKYIRTRYTDWSHTTGHVTAVFVSQVCLFLLFLMYLNEDPETHDPDKVVIFQWLVGVVVTNIAGSEETGVGFQGSVWRSITSDWDKFNEQRREAGEPEVPRPPKYKITARWLYDMFINAFCREVLLGLAPVVLATSERWDFIKDCLAIFFISRLDDLDDYKSITDCIKAYGEHIIEEPAGDEESNRPLLDGQ